MVGAIIGCSLYIPTWKGISTLTVSVVLAHPQLSQIQNQMTPGGGVPGGMVHMSANSRPFVPGGASAGFLKPQAQAASYQPSPASFANPSRSPLSSHRLGHGMNVGSVQLAGLPAFLGTSPISTNVPQSTGFAGPLSPLSPNVSGPASPFVMPQGHMSLGVPRSAGLTNGGNMKLRKGKGPPPVTPLKITGHNSTPSISLNPAAFAAGLAALKAKKKVIVSFPAEVPLPGDEDILAEAEDHPADRKVEAHPDSVGDEPATEVTKTEAARRSHARAAAMTRRKWIQRRPWPQDQHDLVPYIDVPEDAIISCEIHPEPWPHSMGLPDTIEIYLPGMSAWDEYREMRFEEQQREAVAVDQDDMMPLFRPKPLLPSELAVLAADHNRRSLSISTPADPAMVSFKLNRFLQSQQLSSEDPNEPIIDNKTPIREDVVKPFGRFQPELPHRLRDAFARRRGESSDLCLRPPSKHNHTMSLGLPSSGGPFGPEVFSALDMIRANSDEGPSKPPSETHDLPEKPLSDTEAMLGRAEPLLANIAEDDGEQEVELRDAGDVHDADKRTGSGSWKDLGRGFGYEPEPQVGAANGASKRHHMRQASRISVSTSRRDGDENAENFTDGEEVEIRTNPSEDADASDFEEELNEYGPEHWHARRNSVHLSAFGGAPHRHGYEDVSNGSDEDSLRDSLTPSDEQYSNPSDEEAAREERILRRQRRAAERAARHDRKFGQRARANTDNTLPSSSIGEGDLHEHVHQDFGHQSVYHLPDQRARRSFQADIVSNPSDEIQSDLDDAKTFGHPDQPRRGDGDSPRLSQGFRFPPPKSSQAPSNRAPAHNVSPMSGTLGRASGISLLNPGAKEFKFGGTTAAPRTVSAPVSSSKEANGASHMHFRLPSIKTSSFGSSALGDVPANAPHLNVDAPSFTPGAFTFTAPVRMRMPDGARASSPNAEAAAGIEAETNDDNPENREMQGREKRTRYGPIDYRSEDELLALYSTSPPRPKASAASIEGPLRGFSSLARRGPPPFLPPGFEQPQRAASHESRFTAEAPSFVPTWARTPSQFSGSASFKRPTLPDWGQQTSGSADQQLAPSIQNPAFFNREVGSKAIPIRRPPENNEADPTSQNHSLRNTDLQEALSAAEGVATSLAPSQPESGASAADLDAGQTSTETLTAPTPWTRAQRAETGWSAERARPMHIPVGPHSYQSSSASFASESGAGRWGDGRAPSSVGMSSVDRRLRRPGRDQQNHRAVGDDDEGEGEDESLTDFLEEIADRIDKALEGWAGKILDEVTIMGQVRPHPRGGVTSAGFSLDQEKIVQEISRRMEEILDAQLATTFSAHVRKSTDASDETQTTIRPPRQSNPSPDEKSTASLVDAPGEWDFDYVHDVLDVKLSEFRGHIEKTMGQVVERLDSRFDLRSSTAKLLGDGEAKTDASEPGKFVEQITSQLVKRIESLFESHTSLAEAAQTASEAQLQQAVQDKLDENLFLLSEKGAADRSNIQHMLEAELHGLEQSISEVSTVVKEHVQSALSDCLPSLLEGRTTSDATLADRLANQLGQTLDALLAEERRCLFEDNLRNRDLLLEAMPSPTMIAQSTAHLVEPLVKSLKSDPIDSDALVARLAEVIGKQSIEHMVDLNPVLALLEPLIAKQEDARAFSKKILQRQEETERTLSELPGAINAKTEVFLSSASESSEKQGLILQKIAEIKTDIERKTAPSTNASQVDTEAVQRMLEDLAVKSGSTRDTAEKTLSELAGVYQVLNSSYEALSRLETHLASTEESHKEVTSKLEKQAQANEGLARELREAEARLADTEAKRAEVVARLSSSDKESAMLQDRIAQMGAELTAAKADRAKERETSAREVAEAKARAERAEAASADTQRRMERLVEEANIAEREAYGSANAVLERASKAEGQIVALEKRIAEQDNKIANLQQVSATQKQKAAQSHQKLAEGEKRVKELEAKAEELAEATLRLGILENKAIELEDTRRKLEESEEREAQMREEVRRCDERFNEMERDLVSMKEGFVERATHETALEQLKQTQQLVEQLKAQLSASADGWEALDPSSPPKTGAWASMHAPRTAKRESDSANTSAEFVQKTSASMVASRSFSFASTGSKKEVEVDEGGWWS